MLLDIGFFDDAVPTSTVSRRGPAAAAPGGATDAETTGEDVPDWASQIARLKKKIPYRYVKVCWQLAYLCWK